MPQPTHPREFRTARPWLVPGSMGAMRQELTDLLESLLPDAIPGLKGEHLPKVDVSETAEAVDVVADLPGYRPEEVDIDLRENCLTISSKRHEESKEEQPGRRYHRVERRLGSFTRSIWLPCPVDESKIVAQLASGILRINLPKRADAVPHKVEVKGEI